MNTNAGVFKISKIFYIYTDCLEETYYGFTVNKTLNFSITFKDIELLENINYYVNEMGIDVIRPCPRNTVNKINADKSFKSDECVICLTNLPNVLFCNCGHIAICVECDKTKSLKNCPICKTKNTIKRTLYKIFSYLPRVNILFISYNVPMLGYAHHPQVDLYVFYRR